MVGTSVGDLPFTSEEVGWSFSIVPIPKFIFAPCCENLDFKVIVRKLSGSVKKSELSLVREEKIWTLGAKTAFEYARLIQKKGNNGSLRKSIGPGGDDSGILKAFTQFLRRRRRNRKKICE